MQNPNEDTQWNDILRSKGILPPKEKHITEEDVVNLLESTIEEKLSKDGQKLSEMSLDDLDLLEDEEDEHVLLEYRRKRMAEMKALAERSCYGDVREISAEDYVQQVNQAGTGVWVVLHLYKQGIPLCTLLNQHLSQLASKFPATKFLKSVSTTCVPNYPDKNLPTMFIYLEGKMVHQLVGPEAFRSSSLSKDELEWLLGQAGAVETKLEADPRPKPRDVLFSNLRANRDSNDW